MDFPCASTFCLYLGGGTSSAESVLPGQWTARARRSAVKGRGGRGEKGDGRGGKWLPPEPLVPLVSDAEGAKGSGMEMSEGERGQDFAASRTESFSIAAKRILRHLRSVTEGSTV